ncbi:MAG: tRNA1(Val) (adenine(37)-N6)-methyltransferase [Clostridia bacterium]|nr:tRNA1(Val) (adenine(37)-N6)-methyltransferase [Clostridia bacterium]
MNNVIVYPYERIDDLQTPSGYRIIQNPDWFCFGVDAVLLADFAARTIKPKSCVLDMCTGNGIIPILLAEKTTASFVDGIEVQKSVADMAKRSILLNDIWDRVKITCGDLKDSHDIFGKAQFDAVTCNPPYKENFGGLKNSTDVVTIARHEILCNLEDIIESAEKVLKPSGKLYLIHRPERLADILCLMRKYRIEPKRLRFVHPSQSKVATMIMVEGAKHGKAKLFLDPPLYVHNEDGSYTDEINKIYGRKELKEGEYIE